MPIAGASKYVARTNSAGRLERNNEDTTDCARDVLRVGTDNSTSDLTRDQFDKPGAAQ